MKSARPLLLALLVTSTAALAQHPPPGPPPRVDIAKVLNLDATRAEQVKAIMQATHQKMEVVRAQMEAIRRDTDTQLAAVLTPDELEKLHAAMPKPPHRGPPPPPRN